MTAEDLKAEYRMAREKAQKAYNEGLCPRCEKRPFNPHISPDLCLECFNDSENMGCEVENCTNGVSGGYKGRGFCKAHLSQVMWDAYDEYLKKKALLETKRSEFHNKVEEVGFHPRNSDLPRPDMTEKQAELYDEYNQLRHFATRVTSAKREIKEVLERNEKVFPDEYELFG